MEGNERNNSNSKTAKKNSAKSNQSLGNSWNVSGDRSERGDDPDKEIDTAERDKEESKSPNKIKSSFKALSDSMTALEVEAKDRKFKDTVIHKIDDESGTPDDEQIDINNVLGDSDENLEVNEQNNLSSKSAEKNSAKSNQSSWKFMGCTWR